MKLGIVGLPNVGKSTLFNAITNAGAQSANYPFCTIEPNVGVVAVPYKRLEKLAETIKQYWKPRIKEGYIVYTRVDEGLKYAKRRTDSFQHIREYIRKHNK